jgi:hypothetical protein
VKSPLAAPRKSHRNLESLMDGRCIKNLFEHHVRFSSHIWSGGPEDHSVFV